jgi:hypothetical protein
MCNAAIRKFGILDGKGRNSRVAPAPIRRWNAGPSPPVGLRGVRRAFKNLPLGNRARGTVPVSPHYRSVGCGVPRNHQAAPNNPPEEIIMPLDRRVALLALAVSIVAVGPAWPAKRGKALDPDKDGTIDLAEAKNAGSALFDRLDRDHDGTLDARELRGRLDAKAIVAADPDKDGTIDKNEYLSVVEQRFKAADPDNDGTVDAKELASPAGKALGRLLQ